MFFLFYLFMIFATMFLIVRSDGFGVPEAGDRDGGDYAVIFLLSVFWFVPLGVWVTKKFVDFVDAP